MSLLTRAHQPYEESEDHIPVLHSIWSQSIGSPESSSINDLRFAQEPFKIYPVSSTLDFGLRPAPARAAGGCCVLRVVLNTEQRRQL